MRKPIAGGAQPMYSPDPNDPIGTRNAIGSWPVAEGFRPARINEKEA